ncbi:hypothetical protein [Aurantimonas sp. VKM B-3413]|uniref:hypothetical protein n=1 Tax=Aurantimonas sp. VKM B-3413 TaxID=2779401 RepID=UPI001E5821B3|nr:hypothetical protein [Aurantimonas sp. VKM B-3413]MCB8839325.1 hypothetical protein [Aurantimonas sp. VKM B-3413]
MRERETDGERWAIRQGLLALRAQIAGLRVSLAARRLGRKHNFDPNQPRWPKGSGGISGRWRDAGGGSAGARPVRYAGLTGKGPKTRSDAFPTAPGKTRRLRLPPPERLPPGIGDNGGPPLEDPPEIPKRDPGSDRGRFPIAKRTAFWLLRALKRGDRRVAIVVAAIESIGYLTGFFDEIEASIDGPKSLDELRRAVKEQDGRKGTHVHHIVEKASAEQDGFPKSMIEGENNLVRIPRYQHENISAWYQRRNPDYDWQSPRRYLRGRSWEERMQMGLDLLIKEGLLKP